MKISVCYIAKNEAQDLPRSLQSVQAAADEIIFVDTGSTDDSVQIAESYGAKIFHFAWCDDFSAPRNYAIERATGDWIIFPDADEYFIAPDTVRSAVENVARTDADAIMVMRININSTNDGMERSRDYAMRAFRRSEHLRYLGQIHEMLTRDDGKLNLFYADSSLNMYHIGYANDRIKGKLERNMKILRDSLERDGAQPWHYLYLPSHYFGLGEYKNALDAARKAIASPVKPVGSSSEYYHIAIESLRQLKGSQQEMLALAEAAIAEYPDMPEYYAERGMILCGLGEYDEAYCSFLQALDMFEQKIMHPQETSYINAIIDKVYCRTAEMENFVGDTLNATKHIAAALAANPHNDKARRLAENLRLTARK